MPTVHDIDTDGRVPALEARNLSVFYGEKQAIQDVSLVIPAHQVVALIGPSGCGKSTLLRCFNRMNDLVSSACISGEVLFHGQNLYDEVIKVPLLIRVPGWKPRRVEGPISLVDVAPTYLDLMDISVPQDFEGQSLVATMLGKAPVPDRPIFSELLPYTNWKEHHKSLIYGDKKLIKVFTAGTSELYDIEQDPAEQQNIASEDKESYQKLDRMLSDWINSTQK